MQEFDGKNLLLENEIKVNQIIAKLYFFGSLLGPAMFVLTRLDFFEITTPACVVETVYCILAGLIQFLLSQELKLHSVARYFGVIALTVLIGLMASNATVGIYITYCCPILISCLYVNLYYTKLISLLSYLNLIIAMYFRSYDQVKHHFIVESAMRYYVTYTLGFTLEFFVIYLIASNIVKYESMLLEGQQKEILSKLEAQKENKAKSDFLAQMSHEIRTPINAVMGMNEMILRESTQAEIKDYARTVHNAGKSLLAIINDLLDFTKIQSGKMEISPAVYDVAAFLKDLIGMYRINAENKGLEFHFQITDDVPKKLFGDEFRLKQAAGNLISNAIKYTDDGFVNLRISYICEPGNHEEGHFVLDVIDSGIGIKTEDLPKLCSEFGRLDMEHNRTIEGTGLGLRITKQLIEMMGGKLSVQSVYGEGSIFTLDVPQRRMSEEVLLDASELVNYHAEEENEPKGQVLICPEANILIVDDNDMNLQVASSLLKKTQCKLDLAISGEECLTYCKSKKYDLILLDHMMPGMDGITCLHKLREPGSNVDESCKIAVLTANAVMDAKDNYLKEGFDDYLSKPIVISELERLLLECLPPEKIHLEEGDNGIKADLALQEEPKSSPLDLALYGIDTAKGLELLGDELEIYADMASVFVDDYEKKLAKMENALENNDLENYTIMVHGLKSNARNLGASFLGELAYAQELKGKENDAEFIKEHLPELKKSWESAVAGFKILIESVLGPQEVEEIKVEENEEKEKLQIVDLEDSILYILACMEEFQYDEAGGVIKEILEHPLDDDVRKLLESAYKSLDNCDYDSFTQTMKSLLER